MKQEDYEKSLSGETAARKRHPGQSPSNSYWKPRMRADAEASPHSIKKPLEILTPAPNFREDPSMEFPNSVTKKSE